MPRSRRALDTEPRGYSGTVVQPPGSITTNEGTVPRVFTAFWKRWQGRDLPTVDRARRRTADRARGLGRPARGRGRARPARPARRVRDRGARRLPGAARPPRCGRHVPALDRAEDRPARGGDRGTRRGRDGHARRAVGTPALLARLVRAPAGRAAGARRPCPAAGVRPRPVARRPRRARGLEGGAHGCAHRRRRDAPARVHGLDAQPGADDHRELPREGPAHRLAPRASATSGTCSPTATSPRTSATGSGSRAPVPTRRRTSACSTPPCRAASSIHEGAYLRRWVPELAGLDDTTIHEPSTVGPLELAAAGITLGREYPEPIVDHRAAATRAVDAYKAARAT